MNRALLIIPLSFIGVFLSLGCQKREMELIQEPHPSPNLPGAPEIKNLSVLRPYFQTTLGNVDVGSSVGTAFVVEMDGYDRPVVLTALSILGPASGLSRHPIHRAYVLFVRAGHSAGPGLARTCATGLAS